MTEKSLAHITALSLQPDTTSYRCASPEGELWSNGHICVIATVPGAKDYPSVLNAWNMGKSRADAPLRKSFLYQGENGQFFRTLTTSDGGYFIVSEAYWRIIEECGAPHGVVGNEMIAMRGEGGALMALAMTMRYHKFQEHQKANSYPVDADVFENIACEQNGFYLQGSIALRKELADIEAELEDAEGEIEDLQSTVRRLERQRDSLADKIKAARLLANATDGDAK